MRGHNHINAFSWQFTRRQQATRIYQCQLHLFTLLRPIYTWLKSIQCSLSIDRGQPLCQLNDTFISSFLITKWAHIPTTLTTSVKAAWRLFEQTYWALVNWINLTNFFSVTWWKLTQWNLQSERRRWLDFIASIWHMTLPSEKRSDPFLGRSAPLCKGSYLFVRPLDHRLDMR